MHMPVLRHPIVFAHGLLGFDYLRLGPCRLACYWSKLPEKVRAAGNRVFVARVAPLGSIAERAGQLKAFIEEKCPHEEVHIIGHSMGGLDARYMISKLGMASRVLSLTTLGTPHRGTPFADWGLRRLLPVFGAFLNLFGISSRAFEDLSVASCRPGDGSAAGPCLPSSRASQSVSATSCHVGSRPAVRRAAAISSITRASPHRASGAASRAIPRGRPAHGRRRRPAGIRR